MTRLVACAWKTGTGAGAGRISCAPPAGAASDASSSAAQSKADSVILLIGTSFHGRVSARRPERKTNFGPRAWAQDWNGRARLFLRDAVEGRPKKTKPRGAGEGEACVDAFRFSAAPR